MSLKEVSTPLSVRLFRHWRHFGVLFGLSLCIWAWSGCPAPPETCKKADDCPQGQSCVASQCVAADAGESGTEVSTDASEAAPDVSRPDATKPDVAKPESPPFDANWNDGSLPPPDALQDGQTPGGAGTRKEGETCNPGLTALPADKCASGLLCAAPDLEPVGVCQKSCDPKASSCGSGQACGPIRNLETRAIIGHGCGPEVKPGFPCTDGLPCQAGHVCVRYGQPQRGVCQKSCEKRADCGTGWCASGKGLSGDVTACVRLVDTIGDSCANDATCGNGLTCEGDAPNRVCLKQNCTAQAPCPSGSECTPVLDDKGQLRYNACFPTVATFGLCHKSNRCAKGSLCLNFSGTPDVQACVVDCGKDAKLCGNGEICVQVSGNNRGCLKVGTEGAVCDGPVQCGTGLSCLAPVVGGPRFCLKDCTKDATVCKAPSPTQCQALRKDASVCADTCDPKAPNCTGALTCQDIGGKGYCLPAVTPGQAKAGATCQLSAAAAPGDRCGPGLSCVALVEGLRCVQFCDPKTTPSACPTGQSCLRDGQLKRDVCGVGQAADQACNVTAGTLCQTGFRCLHKGLSSEGTCVPVPKGKKGDLCLGGLPSCGSGLLCAGDPTVPFRWTCRQPCDPKMPACGAKETCLSLVSGAACFDTCQDPKDTCPNPNHTCQDVQGKLICM